QPFKIFTLPINTRATTVAATHTQQRFFDLWHRWRPCESALVTVVPTSMAPFRPTLQPRSFNSIVQTSLQRRPYSSNPTKPTPPQAPAPPLPSSSSRHPSKTTSSSHGSGKKPEWTAAMNDQLIQWRRDDGLSWREIGSRFGISNVGCLKHYRNVVQPALDPSHGWTDGFKDGRILHRRLVWGSPWTEIAKEVGLDPAVCMARYKVVLEPAMAAAQSRGNSGIGGVVDKLEESPSSSVAVLQTVLKKWQWRLEEVLQWYRQRVKVIGPVNTKLPEEWQWTSAMDDSLWTMHQQGKDWDHIATALEMSKDACRRRFRLRFLDTVAEQQQQQQQMQTIQLQQQSPSVGRPSRDIWTPALDEQLIWLRQQAGLSWRDIGARLCVSHVACRHRYEATLWPERTQFWSHERETELASYLQQGKEAEEIAAAMGNRVHPMAIGRHARAMALRERRRQRRKEQEAIRYLRRARRAETDLSMWETGSSGEMCPAALEKFYTDEDWDRLLSESHTTLAPGLDMDREKQKEVWRQQQGVWTITQETTLIQQVLQHGLGNGSKADSDLWRTISSAVGGGHSPEACRIRWKNLDMPVHLVAPIPGADWPLEREQAFWRIWQDERPDVQWGNMAQALGDSVTVKECKQYFTSVRAKLLSKSIPSHLAQHILDARLERLSKAMVLHKGGGGTLFWNKARSTQLQSLARVLYGPQWWQRRRLVWRKVARQMGITTAQCRQHWAYLKNAFREGWTRDEVLLLERGVRVYGEDWVAIRSRFLPYRTVRAVRRKWLTISDYGAKVTVDEYMTLMGRIQALREQQDDGRDRIDWSRVAVQLPGWTPAPCRRVWEASYAYLLETTTFSAEEDIWLVSNMDPTSPQDWEGVPQQLDSSKSPWLYRLRWCQLMMPTS
ncbi:hypothetical protein BGZ73_009247, partial [Actinomortierella ambigua]